ncbi:MAG: sigma-70 family RNA polymerase sigma factor [Planctomycetes bacterium]|nr:sigma-70 family RNA polymerase sigma factor [Planctomycetota bacterium]
MDRPDGFYTTVWSEISRAKARSVGALNRFLDRYRAPVARFLKAQGLQEADAEDLTQEVFQRIFEQDLLSRADREKGRFRWLLLGITRNVLREQVRHRRALKRGGGKADVPLDGAPGEEGRLADVLGAPAVEDDHFDQLWVANLIEQATAAVRDADRERGTRYVALLLESAVDEASYQELADRHGLKLQDVKNYLHRAKKRVAAQLDRLVRAYSSSPEEYDAELRFVRRFITGA